MTLPQLIATADCYAKETVSLSFREYSYLIDLLKAYADEILDDGQVIQLGSVTLIKTITGETKAQIKSS